MFLGVCRYLATAQCNLSLLNDLEKKIIFCYSKQAGTGP